MSVNILGPAGSGGMPGGGQRPSTNYWTTRGMGVRYPSPFFDVAQQYLPNTIHELMVWCRFYFLTNPLINVVCQKMAEYPITPVVWETEDLNIRRLYEGVEALLKFRQFQIEVGLDKQVYGNAFASVFFQLEKYLVCTGCRSRYRASKNRSLYKWRNGRFHLKCAKCNHEGIADQADVYPRNIRGARLVRWNPENIEIKHNEITGQSLYYYKLPRAVVNDVKMGDPTAIETLPADFLEAARVGRSLLFHPDNFYHIKRPTVAQKDQGWGSPLLYPVLKDCFYLQVMKKAQEAIMLEHVVPLRIIFPGAPSGGNDTPFGAYNLQNWKAKIDGELSLWKRDPNYVPVLPVNIGYQQIGGQAKALMLHQEMRIHSETILAGCGIPVEFIYGGLSWSGSNTSLRALENMFLGDNAERQILMKFMLDKIANHMGWPRIDFHFEKFRMADDLQRAMFTFQLNQANKVSDRTLLEEIGKDQDQENERLADELKKTLDTQKKMQLASASIQGAASLVQSRYQAKSQELMMRSQAGVQADIAQEQAAAGIQPGAQPGQPAQDPNTAPAGDAAQQDPGLPDGATAYDENAGAPNQSKGPTAMMESPLAMGQGGVDPRYLAQRAKAYIDTVRDSAGAQAANHELEGLMLRNPSMYQLVVQLMNDQGSQVNPMNALKAPVSSKPFQRPAGRMVAS